MIRTATERRWRRRFAVAGASLAAVMALSFQVPAPAQTGGGLDEIGRVAVPPNPNEWTELRIGLAVDSETRRGFRMYTDPDTGNLAVWSFDLDSLKDLQRRVVDDFPAAPTHKFSFHAAVGGGRLYVLDEAGWVHAFDQKSLATVGFFPSVLPPPSGSTVIVAGREQSHGSRRLAPEGQRTTVGPYAAGPGHRVLAFEYLQPGRGNSTGKLLLLTHAYVNEADVPSSTLTLHRWDAATGAEEWAHRLDGCRGGRGFGNDTRYSTGLEVIEGPARELIFGCIGRSVIGEVWRAPIKDDGTVGAQTLAGQVSTASDFLIDPAARRAHALTSSGVGQSIVAVDLNRAGVVGSVGVSFAAETQSDLGGVGAGIDPTTGRVYAVAAPSEEPNTGKRNPGGLVIVDGRRSPLPQGFAYPEHGGKAADMVVVDPASNGRPTRLFIRLLGEDFYRVFADRIPVQGDPPLAAADRFTVDVAEREGQTLASFAGSANGYGARSIFLGGTNAIPDPLFTVRGESATKDVATGFGAAPGCGETNREVVVATVKQGTTLSNTGAAADAAAATADPRTIQDLEQPVASCSPSLFSRLTFGRRRTHPDDFTGGSDAFRNTKVPGGDENADQFIGPSFPFSPAVCLPPDRPSDSSPHDGDGPYAGVAVPRGFTATVSCPVGEEKVEAAAESAFTELGPGISLRGAWNEAVVVRSIGKGVTVEVRSHVKGVTIEGGVSIGRIASLATSTAGGRPSTAATTFTSEMCGVETPTLSFRGCVDPRSEDGRGLVAAINAVLAQRQMELRVPVPDADLAKGTPGGALAAVQKDRFAAQGERLFNNDFSTALPALELVRLHDSTLGRGRQIVQLAGVQASTSYNIALVPTGTAGVDSVPTATIDGSVADTIVAPMPVVATSGRDLSFPSPIELLYLMIRTVVWGLRNPISALSVMALVFTAFALPLHLSDRRRAVLDALTRRG